MHISNVVHIWSKKTKNTNVFLPAFPLKTIRSQLVLLFCFKMYAFDRRYITGNNEPLKVLLSQSQSAISPEVMLAI
jgi:hypothetical protein